MNIDNIKRLIDFDTPTVANGLELLKLRDPSLGYTGPDVRALMPEMALRSRPDSLLTAFCVLVFSTVNSCPPVSPAVP